MKNFLPAIAWAIVILILSAGSGVNLPESWMDFFSWDKLGHAIVYAVLTVLILRAHLINNQYKLLATNILVTSVVISSVYGVLMEIMQWGFFPHRYFEVTDIIANIIGSILGIIAFKYFFTKTH